MAVISVQLIYSCYAKEADPTVRKVWVEKARISYLDLNASVLNPAPDSIINETTELNLSEVNDSQEVNDLELATPVSTPKITSTPKTHNSVLKAKQTPLPKNLGKSSV